MSALLAVNLVLLAQDDTGAADPLAIIGGLLILVCIILYAMLKNANSTAESIGKEANWLTDRVNELEREKEKNRRNTEQEMEQTTDPKPPVVQPIALGKTAQPIRIIHIDDEDIILDLVGKMIRANQAFKNVTVQTFPCCPNGLRFEG